MFTAFLRYFTMRRTHIVVDQDAKRFASEFDYNFGEHLDARNPSTGKPIRIAG